MKLNLFCLFKILIITLFITNIFSNCVLASYVTDFNGEIDSSTGNSVDVVTRVVGTILDIVRLVGISIALIIIIVIGIKIMLAAPNERANIKQYSINYIIGAFILVGASGLLSIIKSFVASSITAS